MAQMRPIEHNVENPGQPITEKKRKKRQKNLHRLKPRLYITMLRTVRATS